MHPLSTLHVNFPDENGRLPKSATQDENITKARNYLLMHPLSTLHVNFPDENGRLPKSATQDENITKARNYL